MTDLPPRLFSSDAAVRRFGAGLLDRSLPRAEWTHEAHLAACLWLLVERPDLDLAHEVRGIISGYNEAVGGVNDDTQGYHHTISLAGIAGGRAFLARERTDDLADRVNRLLSAPEGRRDWPLRFWSHERLFSVAARRGWVEPDLAPLPCVEKQPVLSAHLRTFFSSAKLVAI